MIEKSMTFSYEHHIEKQIKRCLMKLRTAFMIMEANYVRVHLCKEIQNGIPVIGHKWPLNTSLCDFPG